MINYCAQKLRKHAGTIMSETSGDKVRNALADGFIDVARALEKLNEPIEKTIKKQCFLFAIAGSAIGATLAFSAIMLMRLLMQ